MKTSDNTYSEPISTDQNTFATGIPRDSGTRSIWQKGIPHIDPARPENFNQNQLYDVLIVGGGITGLTAAVLLQSTGKKCVLAEAHSIGYGTTGGTTAHINTFLDTTYDQIEKDFGKEGAELVAEATEEAMALIYRLIKEYQINCDFEYLPGYLYAETEEQGTELEKIYQATLQAGVSVRITSDIPVPVSFKKAICYERQAQFHPLKYITGLANEFLKQGGIILENTLIQDLKSQENIHIAESSSGLAIKAQHVIYATHIPPGINLLHFRCAPYRSYAIALKTHSDQYPHGLVYDMQNPYHYFRTHVIDGEKYLILGGSDHKTGHGNPVEAFRSLEEYARQLYEDAVVEFRWSAQYYEPADGLPYIGKLPGMTQGIYTATGYGGNGITYGSIAGKILCELITKGESKFTKVFDPGRIKPVAGFTEFVKENADVAYRFIADRFSAKEIESLQDIPEDSGAIIEYQDKKLAVYKDAGGELHALNPVCTHAKCIVNWNQAEKSWDCPCHGARYAINGEVLNGPASKGLQKVDLDKE